MHDRFTLAARAVVESERAIRDIGVVGGRLHWVEIRSAHPESPQLRSLDRSWPGLSTSSGLYGYGGRSWAAAATGDFVYVDSAGGLRRCAAGGIENVIVPEAEGVTYGDLDLSDSGRLTAVRQRDKEHHEVVVFETSADEQAKRVATISDRDFYLSPRLSRDGRWLAFLAWDKPGIAWKDAQLWLVASSGWALVPRSVTGADPSRGCIRELLWSRAGQLLFIEEDDDGSSLWKIDPEDSCPPRLLWRTNAELGAIPWGCGMSTVTELDDGRLAVVGTVAGTGRIWLVDPDGDANELEVPFTAYPRPSLCSNGNQLYVVAGAMDRFPALVEIDADSAEWMPIEPTFEPASHDALPAMRREWVTSPDGTRMHVLVTSPPLAEARRQSIPTVVVDCHSGPTDQAFETLTPLNWFFTVLGAEVVQVNHRGSSGFGRPFRDALQQRWGEIDVHDVDMALTALEERSASGRPCRYLLRGESGSGLTVLGLAELRPTAGLVLLHAVSDPEPLLKQTHKYERDYVRWLLGDSRPRRLSDGVGRVLIVAGLEDQVVPASQARGFAAALSARGRDVTLLEFPGQGHGLSDPGAMMLSLRYEAENVLGRPNEGGLA